jgi:hypothetical protein
MEYAKAVSFVRKDEIDAVITQLNENQNTKKQPTSLDFDSLFEEQVYQALTKLVYKIDTQVGMSGYRIDLAVTHPNNPQKYILGIECDGAMYNSASSVKERDVYHQRFLESKGGRLYGFGVETGGKTLVVRLRGLIGWLRKRGLGRKLGFR